MLQTFSSLLLSLHRFPWLRMGGRLFTGMLFSVYTPSSSYLWVVTSHDILNCHSNILTGPVLCSLRQVILTMVKSPWTSLSCVNWPLMSRRPCLVLAISSLWLLQTLFKLFSDIHWALGRGDTDNPVRVTQPRVCSCLCLIICHLPMAYGIPIHQRLGRFSVPSMNCVLWIEPEIQPEISWFTLIAFKPLLNEWAHISWMVLIGTHTQCSQLNDPMSSHN